ncbi:glycosyltransferase family 4 protein [Streptosporangium sp. 'caverna']|uniref:glycosyltransferase family 4 protein n=1 Tax=Streptosporangium sp. 'caverna' TaxID=2202249 RepID=UPI000D7D7ED7|nr:glycosyltransferase family 4 protein [Streptosporangium sp. 'caverna']AWS46478.1 glycosyltransferase [Streptosporangium sp. 'caverna']
MTSSNVRPWSEGMRIVMIAPPWYDVPPLGYGGIEAMMADLIAGLTRRGHDVTLIGAGSSGTSARFLATYDQTPSERIGESMPEVLHAAKAYSMTLKLDADIIHDHSLAGPLTAPGQIVPTVVTCHGEVDGELGEYYRVLNETVSLVGISEAQRRIAPDLSWAGVVHNAVDVSSFPFRGHKEDWVLWLGRFNEDKGAHLAIDAARAAGRRIVLAGKLTEPVEHRYFEEHIRPRLGPDAEYVGQADADHKRRLLATARCLLFPILWEEPFGMVMIEAMACGTPVVALGRGAVPEVIVDGVTGFIRSDPAELPAAIEAIGRLDPLHCRAHVERCFDAEVMARGYEGIYRQVIAGLTTRPGNAEETGDLVMPIN